MARRKLKSGKKQSLFRSFRQSIASMKRKSRFKSLQEKQWYMQNLAEIRQELSKAEGRARRTAVRKRSA